MASGSRLSKEDWKKQKELEEARKAGTAPAELDEDGKEINPHIPQYIAQAPWYLNKNVPSLKHQRAFQQKPEISKEWYERGKFLGPPSIKYRKGACKNCGAMTHNEKNCCERPRKLGAKWTGKDIKPDEVIKELVLDFDSKRDRWNGYDPSEYDKLFEQYEKTEKERRERKKKEELNKFMTEPDTDQQRYPHSKEGETKKNENLVDIDSDSDYSDSDKEKEDFLATSDQTVGVKKDPKTRTTIRNLRIREDTAKYLRNLDLNSAYYDPKSRSMRENPNPNKKPEEQLYAGDNFIRQSGDVQNFNKMVAYSFEAYEKGQEVHLQAAPSQAELLYKDTKAKQEILLKKQKESILQKYGGQEHLEKPKELSLAQTETYIEYNPDGTLNKGQGKTVIRSRYEEDVYPYNHKSVWGSYWEDGKWGYACCKQLVKNSYCTGKAGIEAKEELKKELLARKEKKSLVELEQENLKNKPKKDPEQEEKEKLEKLKKAMEKEKNSIFVEKDEKKRPYNSLSHDTYQVTEEEIEAYHLNKKRFEDPMSQFVKS